MAVRLTAWSGAYELTATRAGRHEGVAADAAQLSARIAREGPAIMGSMASGPSGLHLAHQFVQLQARLVYSLIHDPAPPLACDRSQSLASTGTTYLAPHSPHTHGSGSPTGGHGLEGLSRVPGLGERRVVLACVVGAPGPDGCGASVADGCASAGAASVAGDHSASLLRVPASRLPRCWLAAQVWTWSIWRRWWVQHKARLGWESGYGWTGVHCYVRVPNQGMRRTP